MKDQPRNKKTIDFYPLKKQIYIKGRDSKKLLRIPEDTLSPEEINANEVAFDTNSYNISIKVDSIYGVVKLISDSYFIVVEKSELAAEILNHRIYKAKEFNFIPIKKMIEGNKKNSSQDDVKVETDNKFIRMFMGIFNLHSFYYSDTYDLTNNLQTLVQTNFSTKDNDPRFFINQCYVKNFIKQGFNHLNYISPFIFGFISQTQTVSERTNQRLLFTLISRKAVFRLGVRFFSRGTDSFGNVSNFVETEQIINFIDLEEVRPTEEIRSGILRNKIVSFIQIRGSVPVIWNQLPSLKFVPQVKINEDNEKTEKAYRNHFQNILSKYKRTQIVNLIDKKGDQLMLGDFYTKIHQKIAEEDKSYKENVDYTWFDFHHQCKGMKLQNLVKLISMIKDNMRDFKWFECNYFPLSEHNLHYDFRVVRSQTGVIRTNCMDNLDRTNVVQSVFARYALRSLLEEKNIIVPAEDIFQPFPDELEFIFRNCWTDNADQLSILYSGTPALKTDFTRTGKRTIKGVLIDSMTSTKRYFINQFIDYENQNITDFFMKKVNLKNYQFYEIGKGLLKRSWIYQEYSTYGCFPFYF